MKTIFFLLLVALLVSIPFLSTSCSKDEDLTTLLVAPNINLFEDQVLVSLQALENAEYFDEDSTGTWVMAYVPTEWEMAENGEFLNLTEYEYFLVSPSTYTKCIELLKTADLVPAGHQVENTPFGYVDSIVFYAN